MSSAPNVLEYGEGITLAGAVRVVDAAIAEAAANHWAMVIAVVDSSGHLVVLHRMDHAQYGSIEVAQAKARTAINFKRPTKVFQDAVEGGGLGLRMLAMPVAIPIEGGVPIILNGKIAGAIGVSGASSAQDGQVAEAGIRALQNQEL